jgi:hypothetical protein
VVQYSGHEGAIMPIGKHLAGLVKVHGSIAKSLVDHGPTTRLPLRIDADSISLPLSQLKL